MDGAQRSVGRGGELHTDWPAAAQAAARAGRGRDGMARVRKGVPSSRTLPGCQCGCSSRGTGRSEGFDYGLVAGMGAVDTFTHA